MKRYDDPKWASTQAVSLDYNYAMADFVGDHGLRPEELEALTPKLGQVHEELQAGRESGKYAFFDLPYETEVVKTVKRLGKPLLDWCWEFVILGMGGSALGVQALHQALCHPQHNILPVGRRKHHAGLWVLDNIDPDYLYGMLDALNMKRVAVNVISKSGPPRKRWHNSSSSTISSNPGWAGKTKSGSASLSRLTRRKGLSGSWRRRKVFYPLPCRPKWGAAMPCSPPWA